VTTLSRPVFILLMAGILTLGIVVRAGPALAHQRVDFDEGRYLDNAAHILEGHGFATSTVSFFFGDPPRPPRPEDMSSPLYPFLLAALFAVTGISFSAAKALSVVLSLAAIPLTLVLGRRLFGDAAGLLAALLVALQPDQAIVGTWAMTEPLFTSLLLATLLWALPLATEKVWTLGRSVGAGLLCGLLFLVRQNGAAVAAALALFLVFGPLAQGEDRRRRALLMMTMAGAAFLICVPWFARNTSQFGSPTFSRMKNVAWAEHARSLYTPAEEDPSLDGFLRKNGTAGLVRNLAHRGERVTTAFLLAERGPFRWAVLFALAAPLVGAIRRKALFTLGPALLSAAFLLGVAPWSGALPRYLLPVRPLLYLAGLATLLDLLSLARSHLAGFRLGPVAISLVVILGMVWAFTSSYPVYAAYLERGEGARHAVAEEVAGWIERETEPGDVILEGGFLHQYAFRYRRGVVWIPYGRMETALDIARRYRATHFAATAEAIRFRPDLHHVWKVDGLGLEPLHVPDELEPVLDRRRAGVILYRIRPSWSGDGH
jgi:4-amino-4-deoxy-L-arabinose transferase-like glycosyltransferase